LSVLLSQATAQSVCVEKNILSASTGTICRVRDQAKMKVAIIGAGISGLTAAYRLSAVHDVTVFEANDYLGGHTNTVDVELDGEHHAIDTGFIVFNDWTYPNFIALLNELNVKSLPTAMSFSVRCDSANLEYNGSSLNGLFSQRSNLLRPRFYRMLRDILRFNKEAIEVLQSVPVSGETTVGEFLNTTCCRWVRRSGRVRWERSKLFRSGLSLNFTRITACSVCEIVRSGV
jgi:predicted NAD/FAD-binding protein